MDSGQVVEQGDRKVKRQEGAGNAAAAIERFMETRESYIRALETTIQALRRNIDLHEKEESSIRRSLDELVAMQRLGNTISTAVDPSSVIDSLLELTKQVVPVEESMIFQFGERKTDITSFLGACSDYMLSTARHLLEEGILDWVTDQKKTTVVPDLSTSVGEAGERNFVVVPLVLSNEVIGVYIIRTGTVQHAFTDHEVTLLGVLANQAAVAIENLRNIGKLRKTADELKKSQSQMLQAAKLASLGELAGGIAHEINNPLQILLGHIALLAQGNDIQQRIDMVRSQVQRIGQITHQLVSFSRSVPEDLEREVVNVNWAINEIIALVDYQFHHRGITFDLQYSDDVPPLNSNKNYLQQAFLNLLINAKDAMPDGGKMTISTESKADNIVIRFADTGIGIKKENLGKIFDSFFTTKAPGKGTGLGLSITRGIIKKLNGDIAVSSVEGEGTSFTITLPVGKKNDTLKGENA